MTYLNLVNKLIWIIWIWIRTSLEVFQSQQNVQTICPHEDDTNCPLRRSGGVNQFGLTINSDRGSDLLVVLSTADLTQQNAFMFRHHWVKGQHILGPIGAGGGDQRLVPQ